MNEQRQGVTGSSQTVCQMPDDEVYQMLEGCLGGCLLCLPTGTCANSACSSGCSDQQPLLSVMLTPVFQVLGECWTYRCCCSHRGQCDTCKLGTASY